MHSVRRALALNERIPVEDLAHRNSNARTSIITIVSV
jgi:hypothetical protein